MRVMHTMVFLAKRVFSCVRLLTYLIQERSAKLTFSCHRIVNSSRVAWARSLTSGNSNNGESADYNREANVLDDDEESLLNDPKFKEIIASYYSIPHTGQRVIVVQPNVRVIPRRDPLTTADLQLSEACSLVDALDKWRVVDKVIINTRRPGQKAIFGRGNFADLSERIRRNSGATCVFVAVNSLTPVQLSYLRTEWQLPIFDRYTIVLQIFKEHARSKVAKLQVALAEIPYLRTRLQGLVEGFISRPSEGLAGVGGDGTMTHMDTRRLLLQTRESKLKRAVEKLRRQREMLRANRSRNDIPIVAIVGYTNCGKTSLVRVLTGDTSLEPHDRLFATLDVTMHAGRLPSRLMVLYVDTVGFISDIPLSLIEAFRATLEDALAADVVVHLRDVSHPDTSAQNANVQKTLQNLLSSRRYGEILEVHNKIDLLAKTEGKDEDMNEDEKVTAISALTGEGLAVLRERIEQAVIQATGLQQRRFRIPVSGQHLNWLYREASVSEVTTDRDDSIVVSVLISDKNYSRFKHAFADRRQVT